MIGLRKVNIGLLGAENVGKTALARQICAGHFLEEYEPTIESHFERRLGFGRGPVDVGLSDCGACDELQEARNQMIAQAHGLIFVYSIASWESFCRLKTLCSLVKNKMIPMIVIGNKCDKLERQVLSYHGKELANEMQCAFVEVSAKTTRNVDAVMSILLPQLVPPEPGCYEETRKTAFGEESGSLATRLGRWVMSWMDRKANASGNL